MEVDEQCGPPMSGPGRPSGAHSQSYGFVSLSVPMYHASDDAAHISNAAGSAPDGPAEAQPPLAAEQGRPQAAPSNGNDFAGPAMSRQQPLWPRTCHQQGWPMSRNLSPHHDKAGLQPSQTIRMNSPGPAAPIPQIALHAMNAPASKAASAALNELHALLT